MSPWISISDANATLHKAEIDWDGSVFSCQAADFEIAHVSVHVSCPLDQFKSGLASVYLAQPEVPDDTWPPVSSKKYTLTSLSLNKTRLTSVQSSMSYYSRRCG